MQNLLRLFLVSLLPAGFGQSQAIGQSGTADPSLALARDAVGKAIVLEQRGQKAEAEELLESVLSRQEQTGASPFAQIAVAQKLVDMAVPRRPPEKSPYEADVRRKLVALWSVAAGASAVVVANNCVLLARTLIRESEGAEAEPFLARALKILRANYGLDHSSVGATMRALADVQKQLGENDESAQSTAEAERISRSTDAIHHQPEQGAALKVGGGVHAPPRLITRHDPEYSEEARKGRISGNVQLAVVVNQSGILEQIQVILPLGAGLDEQAIKAVRTWRFEPGTKDGQPVAVKAVIEVNFRLL